MERCCGGCKWWSEKRHIVSRERLCAWPIVLPDGLKVSHIGRKYMTFEMGTDCPCYEEKRKWTTARPTVAGWYFWRLVKGRERIVEVSMLNGILYVPVEGGEWQGPLTPGEE